MTTDYGTDQPVTRTELYARVLIACRDHSLPVPASLTFHAAEGATLFVDTDAEFEQWTDFLWAPAGAKRDFYGWYVQVLSRQTPQLAGYVRGLIDEAVSDFETSAEVFEPKPAWNDDAPACRVPYIRSAPDNDDMVARCVKPVGHVGNHRDSMAVVWSNTYTDPEPAYRSVTP